MSINESTETDCKQMLTLSSMFWMEHMDKTLRCMLLANNIVLVDETITKVNVKFSGDKRKNPKGL